MASATASYRLFERAFGFGTIKTERIKRRYLMQEALLRRHGYGVSAVKQQDRLPQLQVPVAKRQLLALEGCDREFRAFQDRKSTRLNSSHLGISYAVFC